MSKPVVDLFTLALASLTLGCGPGGFVSDGSGFGSGGTGTTDATNTSMSDPDPSAGMIGTDSSDGPLETETETETETGANDWTDPETETDTDEPEPEPIDADCTRVWTHVDSQESHGHLGATPIGPGPEGGFVSVTPVLASVNGVNVDARIRSWSPSGSVLWDQQVSWADHRDDPLALLTDELDDVYLSGRINANTFEDAMASKLDGASGELMWIFLRGEPGGYSSIAYNGAAVVVAGMIGEFGDQRLELVALEPDNGAVLWSSEEPLDGGMLATRGLVVADGRLDVLISRIDADLGSTNSIDVLRYDPPSGTPSLFANLLAHSGSVAPQDLERFGEGQLAALYNLGPDSFLAIVDRETGALLETRTIDDFEGATTVIASELVELPDGSGLGIAGTIEVASELQTFVLRLDAELDPICSAVLTKVDLGLAWPPELRGLVVGNDGALYTGGFMVTARRQVFARWD